MIRLDDYVTALNSLRSELSNLHDIQGLSWREIARLERFSGISPTMLWRISGGDYDPKGVYREMLGLPPTRTRLAADVTPEDRTLLDGWLAHLGFKSWTEYFRWKAALLRETGWTDTVRISQIEEQQEYE